MENQEKVRNITGANTMTEKTCPNCNGTNVAEIMYGYPSSQFLDEMKKSKEKQKEMEMMKDAIWKEMDKIQEVLTACYGEPRKGNKHHRCRHDD